MPNVRRDLTSHAGLSNEEREIAIGAQVHSLRQDGHSIEWIAEYMNLGESTMRSYESRFRRAVRLFVAHEVRPSRRSSGFKP